MNQEQFYEALLQKGISLSDIQKEQFHKYYQILVEWNEKMNLTAITDEEGVYLKHFFDSLTMSFDFELTNQKICDVGAGAGFPSIPLKIVYPELNVTIVDSLTKRMNFIDHLVKELGLKNVRAIPARAEEYAVDHKENFDLVTARAVAKLSILDELCLPLVKTNGYFITLKGLKAKEELEEASKGISILGGKIENIVSFTLSDDNDHRSNIYIKKVKPSPNKYPRQFSKIKKKPL